MRNTAALFNAERRRVRAPRYFGTECVLEPYDQRKAEGSEYLHDLEYVWKLVGRCTQYAAARAEVGLQSGGRGKIMGGDYADSD